MIPEVLLASVCALTVGLLSPFVIRPMLERLSVVDVPGHRSSHSKTTLRGGGLAVWLAIFVGGIVFMGASGSGDARALYVFLGTATVAAALGFAEDLRGIPILARALLQVLIGLGTGIVLILQGGNWAIAVLSTVLIAVYINAANFMDGVNAISSLHGLVVGAAFATIGLLANAPWLTATSIIVAVSFTTFLPWNLSRRGFFLGDIGSYLLGASVALLALSAVLAGMPLIAALAPLWIYLTDTGATFIRRFAAGERWYEAHRSHTYQRLTTMGWNHIAVASVVALATAACAAAGMLALLGAWWWLVSLAILVALSCAYLALPRLNRPAYTAEAPSEDARLPAQGRPRDGETWAVLGASGFVGAAVCRAAEERGHRVLRLRAPRLSLSPGEARLLAEGRLSPSGPDEDKLAAEISGVAVVINAAGMAAPDNRESPELFGANTLLPYLVAEAANRVGARLVIHLSSAAVQGRRDVLDESVDVSPFSPYSKSKAWGEQALMHLQRPPHGDGTATRVVVVRATSVQGLNRPTTAQLVRLASSPLASVAGDGRHPTVVSSVSRLSALIAALGETLQPLPSIVLQPWEGLSVSDVLRAAGASRSKSVPPWLARTVISVGFLAGSVLTPLRGLTRRVEMLWFGQAQVPGWAHDNVLLEGPDAYDVLRAQAERT